MHDRMRIDTIATTTRSHSSSSSSSSASFHSQYSENEQEDAGDKSAGVKLEQVASSGNPAGSLGWYFQRFPLGTLARFRGVQTSIFVYLSLLASPLPADN